MKIFIKKPIISATILLLSLGMLFQVLANLQLGDPLLESVMKVTLNNISAFAFGLNIYCLLSYLLPLSSSVLYRLITDNGRNLKNLSYEAFRNNGKNNDKDIKDIDDIDVNPIYYRLAKLYLHTPPIGMPKVLAIKVLWINVAFTSIFYAVLMFNLNIDGFDPMSIYKRCIIFFISITYCLMIIGGTVTRPTLLNDELRRTIEDELRSGRAKAIREEYTDYKNEHIDYRDEAK